MAIHENLTNSIYDKENNLTEAWDQHTGMEVEDFITRKLQDAQTGIEKVAKNDIKSMSYENSTLTLVKENGDTVSTAVTVETPTYSYGIYVYGIMIDNDPSKIYTSVNENLTMLYVSGRNVKVGIAMYAIASTSFSISDRPGPFEVKIAFGSQQSVFNVANIKYEDCIIDSGEGFVSGVVGTTEEIISKLAWVDVTSLFKKAQSNSKVTATVIADTKKSSTLNLNITNEVITLAYSGDYVINSKTALFSLSGASGTYYLEVYNNGGAKQTTSSGSLTYTGLVSGLNQLSVRAVNSTDSSICSDFLYLDLICKEDCNDTVVAINGVRSNVENNGVATLYELIVYSPEKEEVALTTYLESEVDTSNPQPTEIMKYEILGASSYNENNEYKTSYKKYIEISTNNTTMYLLVKVNDSFYNFYTINNGKAYPAAFKVMKVDPIDRNLAYYTAVTPTYNFDQIQGYINNVFVTDAYATADTPANVISNLESSDGWKEEEGRAIFKVSALPTPIFKSPINLGLTTSCTIEMGVKTYNISDKDQPILTIGNFLLRPTLFCWNTADSDLFAARNSLFREGVETHIMITIQKGWTVSKSDIYYPDFLPGDYQTTYDNLAATTPINLVRVYINGIIDREINLTETEISGITSSTLQINPTTADVDFYLFRVYNNVALDFNLVLQNYISFLASKSDKLKFYESNDILGDNGEISFERCYGKYNTLVYVFPKGGRFPNRSWGGEDGNAEEDIDKKLATTLFVNYADPIKNNQYGGRLTHGLVKGLGSSAMRYLIWNVTYALNKLKYKVGDEEKKIKSTFTPYSQMDPDTNRFKEGAAFTKGCYIMPPYDGQKDTTPYEYTKMVGKVNFASSMQSHKVGACKLFDDAYKAEFTSLPSGGRKAVHEEPFLYFYWESDHTYDSSEEGHNDPEKSTILGLSLADLLENNDKIKFMGFQTWGPGKGDDACSGYSDYTPEYLMMEGGENTEPTVNFRVPWHSLQRGTGTLGTATYKLDAVPTLSYEKSLEEPWSNLLIDDESIVYNTRGAWDIDYGCEEVEPKEAGLSNYFIFDPNVHESVKKFREFYDFVYTYNFNLVKTSDKSPNESGDWDTHKKYVVTSNSFSVNETSHKSGDMYRYNEVSSKWVCAGISYDIEKQTWNRANIYELTGTTEGYIDIAIDELKKIFTEGIGKYVSVDDIAFHQAFIKFLSGTDNRAKNTYFLIIGKILEDNPDYDGTDATEEFIDSGKGDYLVRLIGDDLDTILVTDNNGLQSKPYNLLEASYDPSMKSHWGDALNSFFYMFDQCFEKDIVTYLTKILTTTEIDRKDVLNNTKYFYKIFFKVLNEDFPAIAYNHHAKIYYENAQSIKNSRVLSYYGNNNIEPIEQSHGSCLLCEAQFLKERLDFLAGYAKTALGTEFVTASSAGTGDSLKLKMEFEPYQDFYPTYKWESIQYLGDMEDSEYDCIKYRAKAGQTYSIELSPGGTAINQGLYQTDLYRTLNITGLKRTTMDADFARNTNLYIDNENLETYKSFFEEGYPALSIAKFTSNLPVLETLSLKNINLNETLDCSLYLKLKTIDLTGSQTPKVIFPQTGKLENVILPDTIKVFEIYNNPGLQTVDFEGLLNLEEIYIDCDKCGNFNVEEFCESLINCQALKSVVLRNANLNLSEEIMLKFLGLETLQLRGKITIVDADKNKKAISFSTKEQLVNRFGNIDTGSNNLVVLYNSSTIVDTNVTANAEVSIFKSANETYPISRANMFGLSISSGNNVNIVDGVNPNNKNVDGYLNIVYSLSGVNSSVAEIDQTGRLTMKQESDSTGTVTIKITTSTTTITKNVTVNFKWKAPELGDFAYADGSFSGSYDESKTLVGLVYAKDTTDEENGTVYILGSEYAFAKDLYLGYCDDSTESLQDTNTETKNMIEVKNYLDGSNTKGLNWSGTSTYHQVSDVKASVDTLTGTNISVTNYTNSDSKWFYGKYDTERYIIHVSNLLGQLLAKDANTMTNYISSTDFVASDGTHRINMIKSKEALDYLTTEYLPNLENTNISSGYDTMNSILYPYFYYMYFYQPDVKPGEILDTLYTSGNWYVPSMGEMARVIYYRGYSAKGSAFTDAYADDYVTANIDKTIKSGGTTLTTPIFSMANVSMSTLPTVWTNLVSSGKNTVTTIYSSGDQNYSYQVFTGYNSVNAAWKPGANPTSWNYSEDLGSVSQQYWRGRKQNCIPFVLYKYSKPSTT